MHTTAFLRMALILGLLTAVGPFAIDMYLPALPQVGESLHADVGLMQWSLTAFLIAMGAGQVVYGPASDRLGRKPPLYFGLALFFITSVGCALTRDAHALIALRALQGLGGAASMVIARAVVRDLHTGNEAARLMALLMLVFSVSPLLAPLMGSGIIAIFDWRAVFWAVALLSLACMALVHWELPETLPATLRGGHTWASAWRAYGTLVRNRRFMGFVALGGFMMAGFFVFLAGSPFVLIRHYGLTPIEYSLAFSVNAAAFFVSAQLASWLGRRWGLERVMRATALGAGACMLALWLYYLLGGDSLAVLLAIYGTANAFMGLVVPISTVLALDDHGPIAGTASALLGTLQILIGTLAMAIVGLFATDRPLPMVTGMALGPLIGLLLTWPTLRGAAAHPAARA